ncbi:MAG TPA: methyltransferase domain-containing protein [Bryobacterales bacterium]|nr:methyltransferase domain-containing protein [Bryobacterales bacterium]
MAAKSPQVDPFGLIRRWSGERAEKGWWHSFELPDGTRIEGVCDLAGLRDRIAQFRIPSNLHGKRVLDIGTWDGWFAFEMERRGAEVVAIDRWDNPRFREVHARLGSRVDYRQIDMYDLAPERLGRFDIVLFMGVLYHLKHPLLALERVCALTTDMAAVDSFVLREQHRPGHGVERRPVMEFYETDEMGGQTDNWVGPSLECLLALCRAAGFARVELRNVIQHSACVSCYRRWPAPADGAKQGPELIDALHNDNNGINFDTCHDDYVSIWFRADARKLTLDHVRPQVSDYGLRPLHVAPVGDSRWQANFKLPPGLTPGWHNVTVRLGDSLPSNPKPIAVDLPISVGTIELTGLCDGQAWIKNQLDLRKGRSLALWVAGLPENADRNNLRVYLPGRRLDVTYVEIRTDGRPRQVNADLPQGIAPGPTVIEVAIGGARTQTADLLIL